jgi:hypothetical protein
MKALTTVKLDTLDVGGVLLGSHADTLAVALSLASSLEVLSVRGILARRSIWLILELGVEDQGLVGVLVEVAIR